jgi:N utilization substance protein B
MNLDSHHTEHHTHGESRNSRREARELALRMLFQIELGKQPVTEVLDAALAQSQLEGANRAYAEELVRGTLTHQKELDERLSALTTEWASDRQATVDRNLLRLASYELLYRPDAPVAAVVNEAVELAKKYSTAESGRFVNGVLGALARKPHATAPTDARAESHREEPGGG